MAHFHVNTPCSITTVRTQILVLFITKIWPEMQEKLRLAGSAAVVMSIPELEAFREQEYRQMADLVKRANIKID